MSEGPGLVCPAGYTAVHLDDVGSTNAEAFERARQGAASGLWVVARRQTAGRGRRGRVWTSEPGNLYSSLMLRDPMAEARLGELPLVVALAVHDAVAAALPPLARADLAIKWPNDILYAGAKLCGILIEAASTPEGRVVVIGIGLNCGHHPDVALYRATDLAEVGYPTEPAAMFALLAAAMARRLAEWQVGDFAPLREAWLSRAQGIGEAITVRLPTREVAGVFSGLDMEGRLLLRHDGELEAISAGDVFFGHS
ncbi:biotin--[acetyl-CoA-carboxylase] ligase [Pleomorphomonas diazotrophica]|uniref:biotin--[biotin carboxyl-carrier protein] ligase n=1 Tax=Pleomorphomonas diazotrophica TaxID=1166257 RepID=A0A1I4Q3Q3_9HYPH|nr:biotin--[acetyl-CoA-carboxylase] ligase [Pleomorphomonas diazotrophica]PKR90985.1 biotin--[acetyl-CoA-carboxylase] ligase [Pleomorphomonas diazotrophica]SFM34285.1 BirA family transcriptional regulator, biotin operon repressor / biotin-[acetyl-CoA-carboxylase] ligase [Pleomorphomonas diazotrophica]